MSDPLAPGNVVAAAAANDLLSALSLIDAYKATEVHVTGVEANVQIRRGQRQAFLRDVRLPRRGRAGHSVPATLTLRHVRGRLEHRRVRLRLPGNLRPGRREIQFTGTDVDLPEGDFTEIFFDLDDLFGSPGGSLGAPSLRRLVARIEDLARYDGISARRPRHDPEDFNPGRPSYRDPDLRISGSVRADIRIVR